MSRSLDRLGATGGLEKFTSQSAIGTAGVHAPLSWTLRQRFHLYCIWLVVILCAEQTTCHRLPDGAVVGWSAILQTFS